MDKMVLPNDVIFSAAEKMMDEGKSVLFIPKGNSMLPFIKGDRDSVCIRRAVPDDLKVGAIVLARISGKYILHRIFSIETGTVTLMGDGNTRGREICTEADVIAVVTEIHKENGKVLKPGDGRLWRRLLPIRRYLLWIYRKMML